MRPEFSVLITICHPLPLRLEKVIGMFLPVALHPPESASSPLGQFTPIGESLLLVTDVLRIWTEGGPAGAAVGLGVGELCVPPVPVPPVPPVTGVLSAVAVAWTLLEVAVFTNAVPDCDPPFDVPPDVPRCKTTMSVPMSARIKTAETMETMPSVNAKREGGWPPPAVCG